MQVLLGRAYPHEHRLSGHPPSHRAVGDYPEDKLMTEQDQDAIFFDPWIDRRYYYHFLPILPLVFHRVYIYYPSDRCVINKPDLSSTLKEAYVRELLYWIEQGAIVPVVQGNYPLVDDISTTRKDRDGPTSLFMERLRALRQRKEETWILLQRGATQRGRDEARTVIRQLGGISTVTEALNFKPTARKNMPELAYYYGKVSHASRPSALEESIGTYRNDDWIRREFALGEYLLPRLLAYQYRTLQDLQNQPLEPSITHTITGVAALDEDLTKRRLRSNFEWIDREKMREWRELGLHFRLRQFLASESAHQNLSEEPGSCGESGVGLQERLAELRSSLPVDLAVALIDRQLLLDVITAISGTLNGFVTSGPVGAVVGGVLGVVIGRVGQRIVRLSMRRCQWSLFLDYLELTLSEALRKRVNKFILGFGDVTVLGSPNA